MEDGFTVGFDILECIARGRPRWWLRNDFVGPDELESWTNGAFVDDVWKKEYWGSEKGVLHVDVLVAGYGEYNR